jgi:FkbM family methyltransferase
LAEFCKWAIRRSVYFRLQSFPLNTIEAERWAKRFQRWPGILDDTSFSRRTLIPPGIRMDLGIVDVIQRTLLVTGVWDTAVTKVIECYLKPGDTFLDVGANIGYFSLLASEWVGKEGLVLSFEPSLRPLEKLLAHIRLNHCSNIVVISSGLGERNSLSELHWAGPYNIGASSFLDTGDGVRSERVSILNLDKLLTGFNLVPTFIKVDVEGYEMSALKGMVETLTAHSPAMVLELSPSFLTSLRSSAFEVLTFMESLGYRGYAVRDEGGLVGCPLTADSSKLLQDQTDVVFTRRDPKFPISN